MQAPVAWLDPCAGEVNELCRGPVNVGSESTLAIVGALPIFVSAYTCQQNAFSIITELENPTQPRKLAVRPRPVTPWALRRTVLPCVNCRSR